MKYFLIRFFQVCVFLFLALGFSCGEVVRYTELNAEPYFDPTTATNVTAQLGMSAYLHCNVKQLGNKSVAWIRARDNHILTIDKYSVSNDQRVQVILEPNTWILQIKNVQARDAGQYECQVNTQAKMSFYVALNVIGFSSGEVVRYTELNAEPYFDPTTATDVTAQLGMSAYLHCNVKQLGNKSVSWIRARDDHILTLDKYSFSHDQRFQVILEPNTWILQVKNVQARDAGQYECQVSTQPKMIFYVTLNVIGDHPSPGQQGKNSATQLYAGSHLANGFGLAMYRSPQLTISMALSLVALAALLAT